ncbi:hydrolase, partial [Listeria monocytogenes]|uniref:carbon-nitrogen hydrolase family protein n=1 Tax=Listeria monocytogenes TaxID=1639 RepID=UPI00140A680B
MTTIKLALIQQKAVPNNKEANLKLSIQYIKEAHEKGADLVLFPEMWSNCYAPPFEDAFNYPLATGLGAVRFKWLNEAIEADSAYVSTLKKLAKELQIGIYATYLSKPTHRTQNTAIFIDR